MIKYLFAVGLCFSLITGRLTAAQEPPSENLSETILYVTTQDFTSFREGPGTAFERLAVIPPATTLPAVGRTPDGRWIQVRFNEQYGWVAYWLLVWNGDITTLKIDGINPVPFVRLVGVLGKTTRETPIYHEQFGPDYQVGSLPPGAEVELTGRLGSGGFFRFQIRYEGQVYWVGSWNIRVINGNYLRLIDTSYLYPYGRLVGVLGRDISQSRARLQDIERIWRNLESGQSVRCDRIPVYLRRQVSDNDVQRVAIFAPSITALDSAIADINTAISAFEDACGRPEDRFYLTIQEVQAALGHLEDAQRNLTLADSLLRSLSIRDPLLDNN